MSVLADKFNAFQQNVAGNIRRSFDDSISAVEDTLRVFGLNFRPLILLNWKKECAQFQTKERHRILAYSVLNHLIKMFPVTFTGATN